MDKRISQRKSSKLIAAAAAATLGLVGMGTQKADASLVVNLRATGVFNGSTLTPVVNPQNVTVAVGNTVFVEVVARITGTNGTQPTGNFDGFGGLSGINDTKNDESLGIVTGSFNSVGASLKGNWDQTDAGAGPNVGPWNDSGAKNGVLSDWDSDGDLDIGANPALANGTDPTNMWIARSATAKSATISKSNQNGTRIGWSSGTTFTQDLGGANSQSVQTAIVDANTSDLLIAEMAFVVTSGSGQTVLTYVPRPGTDSGAALWSEDGDPTPKIPNTTGTYAAGTGVTLNVPEPTSMALLGIGALGLLARRRKNA